MMGNKSSSSSSSSSALNFRLSPLVSRLSSTSTKLQLPKGTYLPRYLTVCFLATPGALWPRVAEDEDEDEDDDDMRAFLTGLGTYSEILIYLGRFYYSTTEHVTATESRPSICCFPTEVTTSTYLKIYGDWYSKAGEGEVFSCIFVFVFVFYQPNMRLPYKYRAIGAT